MTISNMGMLNIMNKKTNISLSEIIFDKSIYPRFQIDRKRVDIFIENIKDGLKFDPVEVEAHPGKAGKFLIIDGVHRWSAYKAIGTERIDEIIMDL